MNLASGIMKEVFEFAECQYSFIEVWHWNSINMLENARACNSLPTDIKECKILELLKSKIKNWEP